MGLFSRKNTPAPPAPSTRQQSFPPGDERYPGVAGYQGQGLKKNAMPEMRFKFVRPDGKPDA
jgi:hypothetical protein